MNDKIDLNGWEWSAIFAGLGTSLMLRLAVGVSRRFCQFCCPIRKWYGYIVTFGNQTTFVTSRPVLRASLFFKREGLGAR